MKGLLMSNESVNVLLVPVDGSEGSMKALKLAVSMARRMQVPIDLLFSFPRNAIEMFGPPGEAPTQNQLQYMSEEAFSGLRDKSAQRVWETARAALGDASGDLTVREILLSGEPAESIIAHADSMDGAMILVGSRGLSRFREILLGSVSQRLVHHANCPVTVVH